MESVKAFFDPAGTQLTPEMEEKLFSSLMMRNKTYKTTYSSRFSEVNSYLVQQVKSGGLNAKRVLDIGISSGISALELHDDIRSLGYHTHLTGTDILIDAWIVRVMPGCYAMIDDTQYPLMFDIGGRNLKPWITSHDYRTGFFLIRKLVNVTFTRLAKLNLSHPLRKGARKVKLVTPRLFASGDISIIKDDITAYNPHFAARFDFIRAANVLNKAYFHESTLTTMLGNIRRYLAGDGSSLLVMRTHEDHVNHGTLFHFGAGGRCEVMQRFGQGSEVEDLVLRLFE
jgi:hypothetical protein